MRREAESKVINRLWTYIVLSIVIWAVVTAFVGYRMYRASRQTSALPLPSTIPGIETDKISRLQEKLDSRFNRVLTATPSANFRPEPFD